MKSLFRNNGLSIVWLTLFMVTWLGLQGVTGWRVYNDDQRDHGGPEVTFGQYFTTAHFVEATMENWESEFLQMFLYVVLTAYLVQKGSAESKKLGGEEVDKDPKLARDKKNAPWPVRRGGWILRLYSYSLSLAFLALFLTSFFLHAAGGARVYNEQQHQHGHAEDLTPLQYMTKPQFWFESTQNWQSEFLAVGSMVVLSIWLRHKGSPESKPVEAPHSQTGKD